jgi:threonine dehydrogenase-like Zn-dependent dehydrogenase
VQCGADVAINVREHGLQKMQQAMSDLGMLEGFDVGLEMSGNQAAINDMIRTMNNGGKIALLGIPSNHVRPGGEEMANVRCGNSLFNLGALPHRCRSTGTMWCSRG